MFRVFAIASWTLFATFAAADFRPVTDGQAFQELVDGKTLTRPFIKLVVSSSGQISGSGASRDVTGTWTWQNGYFCRDLFWGERELGYNCQAVAYNGSKIRFQSDKGAGDYADFSLK